MIRVMSDTRHLFQRIDEHRYSAIGKHLDRQNMHEQFNILKICRGKL